MTWQALEAKRAIKEQANLAFEESAREKTIAQAKEQRAKEEEAEAQSITAAATAKAKAV